MGAVIAFFVGLFLGGFATALSIAIATSDERNDTNR